MITTKKLLNGLNKLGTLTCFSIRRVPRVIQMGLPAYTKVWGFGPDVQVTEETYGRITHIYFNCCTNHMYNLIQEQIRSLGGKIDSKYLNKDYNQGGRVTVSVSPIKGWHHWE